MLPVGAGVNGSPSFSPDWRTIAYDHAADETGEDDLPSSSDGAVQVIGVDGSGLRTLTGPGIDASDPAWSPDGTRIAFTRDFDEDASQVFVMNADGGNARRITSRRSQAADPAWSPDSARVVFTSTRASGASLYHVAATGGRAVRLTTGRGADIEPAWQSLAPTPSSPPVVPSAGPPAIATPDARTVGVLLRAFVGLVPAFASEAQRAADLLRASKLLGSHARRMTTAARSLRPVSRRGRAVRRTVLERMSLLKDVAVGFRLWSQAVRRHDRRAARTQREGVLLGLVLGVAMPLAAGSAEAGLSQAML